MTVRRRSIRDGDYSMLVGSNDDDEEEESNESKDCKGCSSRANAPLSTGVHAVAARHHATMGVVRRRSDGLARERAATERNPEVAASERNPDVPHFSFGSKRSRAT